MTESDLFDIKPDAPDPDASKAAKTRFDDIAKPLDGFGRFEDIICKIAGIQKSVTPDISRKVLVIMIADNGVIEEGVSQTGPEVTALVASLMGQGKSSVGTMTAGYPVTVFPVDVGIDSDDRIEGVIDRKVSKGTGNIAKMSAMTVHQALEAISVGIKTAKKCRDEGFGIVATGEMGIGNTTTSTALYCALTGRVAGEVAGRGAGLSDEGLLRKIGVIDDTWRIRYKDLKEPLYQVPRPLKAPPALLSYPESCPQDRVI